MSDPKPEMKEITCRCNAVLNVFLQPTTDINETISFSCPNCSEPYSLVSGPIKPEAITIVKSGIDIQPHDLDPRKIYDILVKKGAHFLFHANTVGTSCTYMEQGSLLSRQQVEQRGLFQTVQYTDRLDKEYQIYNDVFLDFVDIHARKRDINHYGPVLFEFPLTLLLNHPLSFVRITKVNPDRWLPNDILERRYFTSAEEFEQHYQLGNFGAMMLLTYIDGELQLSGNLSRLIIDAPGLSWKDTKAGLYDEALVHLKSAREKGVLDAVIAKKRICNPKTCSCYDSYSEQISIKRLFKGHATN